MIHDYLHLNKILDLNKWKRLQDSLATVTKLAILTVDYKGNPVTGHSSCQSFCSNVRKDPELLPLCQKCDARGGLEAVRLNAQYVYLCHFNIVDIAIPITIEDQYIGAVMAGQVKLADPVSGRDLEQIVTVKNSSLHLRKQKHLQQSYDDIPTMTYEEIIKIASMLSLLCNYIVEEAIHKNVLTEMFEKAAGKEEALHISTLLPGFTIKNIETIKKEMTTAIADAYLKNTAADVRICANPVLQPAFDYIFSNKSKSVALTHMAELCHLSPSYFSRLFAKETGENFTGYLARLKMKWAKQLLEITDLPVAQVSEELGFNEPGYFIKTFRKFEHTTPALYRKQLKQR
ncbi:AraC family transcriptional regulator [Paenibacillus albidus]|uniref:AraC family transcriptional regulator n=1 Tax=Paenibacillus albidus TaxID=2041023 RepID=A0A917CYU0_9BACL|nr:PocR ligand-binding domain-containing protein [Paenibacillus albidus]GGG03216.1 AraC family transcriptional regulator [Paenibacillus albidus]